jgi:hypothetical protein
MIELYEEKIWWTFVNTVSVGCIKWGNFSTNWVINEVFKYTLYPELIGHSVICCNNKLCRNQSDCFVHWEMQTYQEKVTDDSSNCKTLVMHLWTYRLQTLELEGASLREECTRLRSQVERLRAEKQASEELRGEEQVMLAALREELQTLRDIERRTKDERRVNAQVGSWAEEH